MLVNIGLENGRLVMDFDGGAKRPLTAQSEKKFFLAEGGAQVEFFEDDQGAVSYLIARIVEGDFKMPRRTESAKK
jgi:hypothetical protein